MTTTIKDAADDAGFITALMALQGFNDKVYIKAASADEVYTKTAADTAFVKTIDLATKAADKAVVEAIFNAQDLTDPANPINVAETKIGATFAKKTDLDNKADANGTNLDDAKVTAILEKLTDKVVKTSELSAKAADKAVVEAILDAKDDQNQS